MCSVGTQYAVKFLVDSLTTGIPQKVWLTFSLLVSLIAADNLLWRAAGWVASTTFVKVTGDLRRDLFRHLTGHAPSYFCEQMPGTLTSRITATSNAVFAIENMFIWNVMPPCLATLFAIALIGTVSLPMAWVLSGLGGVIVVAMFALAAAGKPLHHDFAAKAAAVDSTTKPKAGGERYWVQVAGGANRADLNKAWAKLKSGPAGSVLKGRSASTSPLKATNRLLVGPFADKDEAQGFINKLAAQGTSSFHFVSAAGQKVDKLQGP